MARYQIWFSESAHSRTLLPMLSDHAAQRYKAGGTLEKDAVILKTFSARDWTEASQIYDKELENMPQRKDIDELETMLRNRREEVDEAQFSTEVNEAKASRALLVNDLAARAMPYVIQALSDEMRVTGSVDFAEKVAKLSFAIGDAMVLEREARG